MIEAVVAMALCVGFLVMLPLLVVGAAIKLLLALVLLPFKILGMLLKVVLGLVAAVVSTVGALGFALAGLLLLVALPLLPLLLLGGFVWALVKVFGEGTASPAFR